MSAEPPVIQSYDHPSLPWHTLASGAPLNAREVLIQISRAFDFYTFDVKESRCRKLEDALEYHKLNSLGKAPLLIKKYRARDIVVQLWFIGMRMKNAEPDTENYNDDDGGGSIDLRVIGGPKELFFKVQIAGHIKGGHFVPKWSMVDLPTIEEAETYYKQICQSLRSYAKAHRFYKIWWRRFRGKPTIVGPDGVGIEIKKESP